MCCVHPVLDNHRSSSNNDTVNLFVSEMRKTDFSAHVAGRVHIVPKSHIPKDFSSVSKAWFRVNRVRRSLKAPYCGSFEVINGYDKYFVL